MEISSMPEVFGNKLRLSVISALITGQSEKQPAVLAYPVSQSLRLSIRSEKKGMLKSFDKNKHPVE